MVAVDSLSPIKSESDDEEIIKKLSPLNDYLAKLLIPNDVVLVLYLVVGLFGNLLVIYVYSFKLKTKRDNRFFIPFLAVLDLLACVIGDSFALSLNILPVLFRGDAKCKVLWFLSEASTISSGLLLLIISMQRYLKVCRPFEAQMTSFWKKTALVVTVVSACLISCPSLVFYGEIRVPTAVNVTGFRCGKRTGQEWLVQGVIVHDVVLCSTAVIGITTMTVLYTLISRVIYRQYRLHRKKDKNKNLFHKKGKTPEKSDVSISNISNEAKDTGRRGYEKQSSTTSPSTEVQSSASFPTTPETDLDSQPQFSVPETEEQSIDDIEDAGNKQIMDTENKIDDDVLRKNSNNDQEKEEKRKKRRSFDVLKENLESIRDGLKPERVYNHLRVHRCTYMFMTITVIFVIAYIPRMILMLLESVNPQFWNTLNNGQIRVCLFLYRMYLLNHVTNPFIYGLFDSRFRSKAKRLLTCQM